MRHHRLPALITTALGLLLGAFAYGCSGEESGECAHCCACTCSGGTCNGAASYFENRSSCLDCDTECPRWCTSAGCGFQSARSCDSDPSCSCNCQCADCATTENTHAETCYGDCPSCAEICRDGCIALGCTQILEFPGSCT